MASDRTSAGTVLAAFALGALAGAAVALLFAPAAGEETRRRLAEAAQKGREGAEALVREGRDLVERHRDDLTAAIDQGRAAFDAAREDRS
jgi:gas vesicle protein